MRTECFAWLQRVPRVPLREDGTSKININKPKVPLVPSVPSIIYPLRMREFCASSLFSRCLSTLWNFEGTEGTKGTLSRLIMILEVPSPPKGTILLTTDVRGVGK